MEHVMEWWSVVLSAVLAVEPVYWASGGGVFLLTLLVMGSRRRQRRRQRRTLEAPNLQFQSFQVAPLGRDAYFKLHNLGQPAVLHSLVVKNRPDIVVKNSIAGHELGRSNDYSILLEAAGAERIASGIAIELTFADRKGNVYRQTFRTGDRTDARPKLLRTAGNAGTY